MNNIFDKDYMKINDLTFKYGVISLFIVIALIIILIIVKKDRIYQNNINFIDNKKGIILVDKDMLNKIKENKKIYLNNISYEYNIEKIEENDDVYLVYITFDIELLNIKTKVYELKLDSESLLNYIIRIMKG